MSVKDDPDIPGLKWHVPPGVRYLPFEGHEHALREQLLQRFSPQDRGGAFVDVGANVGYYAIPLASRFDSVYAIDPQPVNGYVLEQNAKLNGLDNITVVKAAAWDTDGDALTLTQSGVSDTATWVHVLGPSEERSQGWLAWDVRSMTIDSLGLHDVRLVKVDVEGTGHKVIAGAMKTIASSRPLIVVEVHVPEETAAVEEVLRTVPGYVRTTMQGYPSHVFLKQKERGAS